MAKAPEETIDPEKPVPTEADEDFDDFIHEQHRRLALRTFEVHVGLPGDERSVCYVTAHNHSSVSSGMPGHLDFYTTDENGISRISDSFNTGYWLSLHEIHDPARTEAIRTLLSELTNSGNVETISKGWIQ